jgi:hypothetical protein
VSSKNLDAQFVLEFDDGLRYPRLRGEQRLGSLGEVEVLADGFPDEPELVQIHI